jgi:hypothetical protein
LAASFVTSHAEPPGFLAAFHKTLGLTAFARSVIAMNAATHNEYTTAGNGK